MDDTLFILLWFAQLGLFLMVEGFILYNVRRTAAATESLVLSRVRDGNAEWDAAVLSMGKRLVKRVGGEAVGRVLFGSKE